jgi:hypothetical protein
VGNVLHLFVVLIHSLEHLLHLRGSLKEVADQLTIEKQLCLLDNRLVQLAVDTFSGRYLPEFFQSVQHVLLSMF